MTGPQRDHEPGVVLATDPRWRRKRVLAPAAFVTLLLLAIGAAWLSRERIAGTIIQDQLEAYGISASYELARVTGQRQLLRKVVVGNPARPDFTADAVEVRIAYRLGTPTIGRVTLIRPRLYGRLANGRVSFGSLDKAIYRDTSAPPGLPDIDLAIRDGRALIRSAHGPLGLKLDGAGRLSDGFAGTLAAAAPAVAISGCDARGLTLFGRIVTRRGEPSFAGPVRLGALACAAHGLALGPTSANVDLTADRTLASLTGRASVEAGAIRYAGYAASGAGLTLRGSWKDGVLTARHTAALRGIATPHANAALLTLDGSLRASGGFADLDWRTDAEGNGLRPGQQLGAALARLTRAGKGTLVDPLAGRFAAALASQARGSGLTADVGVRRHGGITSVMVPRAELRGGGGARIASLSRVEARLGGAGAPRLAGNIATGGPGLPEISGRMERAATGQAVFRLTMQPYAAGDASLEVPQLTVTQAPGGAVRFAGRVLASGPLPGGGARGLSLPVEGQLASGGRLSLWRTCTAIAFDRLSFANLSLERRGLTLCPVSGRAILESGPGGLRLAAGAPGLDLAGTLGETPIRVRSGAVGFAWPGAMSARAIDVALGPPDSASRFSISNLSAQLGERAIAGRFDGADIRLAAVPLDLREAAGEWRYADGALMLDEAAFRLVDRSAEVRFEPLEARGAALRLHANVITAQALLRHPGTGRIVTEVALRHDLRDAAGHADLQVPGVVFDAALQPDGLTRRALGVIANARGTVTGSGRIDWNGSGVTSRGDFATDGLDFAAAFGPVKGARGTVHFDDLIGLTTAPGQRLRIDSVNPGIEVLDGEFAFQLRQGTLLAVEGGSWPFMGGRLVLRKVDLNFGIDEARRYDFVIEGLDAAAFIARFELPNIAATGRFDGALPIVFDTAGNGRIEGGLLVSRPPGGNVSYVGDLTYADLSTMANFAFDALRSLDYERMTIAMNGSLTGEIVTNVRFDGVKQGEGAKRNLATRALASLPIQFRINITAPFYQLITSFRSLRDPAAVRDPRDLGLLSDDGTRFLRPAVRGEDVPPKITPDDLIPKQPPVQNQESEKQS